LFNNSLEPISMKFNKIYLQKFPALKFLTDFQRLNNYYHGFQNTFLCISVVEIFENL
jgi:hypothetical protein